ncbi:hypothetical protein FQN60_011614 [Etheostoma spectabile]|uniref:Uncharacterized protein n=1 Tax=Etheostoma spectabile TaxID=54343 RepID=A0A5J5DMQ2_9PERO|nr:hypothetical protein FQN60_011614 [Etheostoma spectabile]
MEQVGGQTLVEVSPPPPPSPPNPSSSSSHHCMRTSFTMLRSLGSRLVVTKTTTLLLQHDGGRGAEASGAYEQCLGPLYQMPDHKLSIKATALLLRCAAHGGNGKKGTDKDDSNKSKRGTLREIVSCCLASIPRLTLSPAIKRHLFFYLPFPRRPTVLRFERNQRCSGRKEGLARNSIISATRNEKWI